MDINGENDHVISSDEYSDESDYDDTIMIDSIRAQYQNVGSRDCISQNKPYGCRMDQKRKQISSLIRRNKIPVIYKKKSIKWLNNKRQREQYKTRLPTIARNVDMVQREHPALSLRKTKSISENIKIIDQNNQELDFEINETDFNPKKEKGEVIDINKILQNSPSLLAVNHSNHVANITSKKDDDEKSTIIQDEENMMQTIGILTGSNKQTNDVPRKRSRSKSSVLNQNKDRSTQWSENKFKSDFVNLDKTAANHISNTTSGCSKNVDDKLKILSIEINKLNDILHAKEMELNRLCHLKMVKEEMYCRLNRQRNAVTLREGFCGKLQRYSSCELKELEISLTDKKDDSHINYAAKTVHKLIENRANMNAEDLKLEKNNTNRLHSILVSKNMLQPQVGLINKYSENSNYINGKMWTDKPVDLYPQHVMRIKLSDLNVKEAFSLPLFENNSRPQFLKKEQNSGLIPILNPTEEISVTPVSHSKKLSPSLESVRLIDSCFKSKIKGILNEKYPRKIEFPLCQECKAKESRFVCAGCGNQWYCSKNCQITAWDIHSEICTE